MRQTTSESSTLGERRFHIGVDVHALLIRHGRVLLVSEPAGNHQRRVYRTPSGRLEEGESVVDALVRVGREALGVTVAREGVSLAHVVHRVSGERCVALFFAVSRWDGEPTNAGPELRGQLCWAPLHHLSTDVADLAGGTVHHCVGGEAFASTHWGLGPQTRFRSDIAAAVAAFHEAFDLPRQTQPTVEVDDALVRLRAALLREELDEFVAASSARDLVGVADALADIVYVAYGTALTYGIDLDLVLVEVHRSNMSKLDRTGRPLKRNDGKVAKSDQYFPPDIAAVLKLQSSGSRR